MKRRLLILCLVSAMAGAAQANTTISLASTMNGAGGLTENAVTGSQARINLGNGGPGDADGVYDINAINPTVPLGSDIDVFPKEGAFDIGSLTVDAGLLSGTGSGTIPVTALDMSGFWADGSSTTDVSDTALDAWFSPLLPRLFAFDAFDGSDTATFANGLLTSIDASVAAQFTSFDFGGNPVTWDGTLEFAGDAISLTFNDTQTFVGFTGPVPSTFTSDLTGTVDAVGTFSITAIPEPNSLVCLTLLGTSVMWRCRRRGRAPMGLR
ncbi:MAG: hypothetical protein AAGJ40_00725 [Planctomycetota bacterium]